MLIFILRGHGTYLKNDGLYSSVAGVLERINKLITVKALKARYSGDIGDVVIGRIIEVRRILFVIFNNQIFKIGSKKWKLEINSRQDASLLLSSIHLPGAIQVGTIMLRYGFLNLNREGNRNLMSYK